MDSMNLKIKLILFLIVSHVSFGQTDLSAKQAVFVALENNYQILIANKQHEINEKNNKWSQAGLFPTVSLNVSQGNAIQDNTNNPFTFTPGIILSQSINPSLSADWNIFSGFAVRMSKQRLEQLEEQSANNALAVIETTTQDVLKAYYTAQLQDERQKLFQSILDLSRERFEYYQLKEKYSSSNSMELMQFKNQYLNDSINYIMQEISSDNSRRNLKLLMNDTTDVQYTLTDKLDLAIIEIDVANAKKQLFENNANLKNQYISMELQRTNTAFQKSFLYPTLSFQAGVNPGWSWIKEIKNNAFEAETKSLSYYGNLNLRYTLFNNWKNQRAVEVSKIQEEISQLNINQMQRSLGSTLDNLVALFDARSRMVNISTENIIYAEKMYDMAKNRFELGSINSIDLTSLQNSYENTMIKHYENLFNKLDTYLEIYKMTGKLGLEYGE